MRRFLMMICFALAILLLVGGSFVVSKLMDLKAQSAVIRQDAIATYGGDEVMALARYVDDVDRAASKRNYAIGMLANLSDSRALPYLERHYVGYEPYPSGSCCKMNTLCQYELKKAIARSRENKGMNLLTMVLR